MDSPRTRSVRRILGENNLAIEHEVPKHHACHGAELRDERIPAHSHEPADRECRECHIEGEEDEVFDERSHRAGHALERNAPIEDEVICCGSNERDDV